MEAVRAAGRLLNLHEHERIFCLTNLEDGTNSNSPSEYLALHDISQIFESKVQIKVLFLDVVRDCHVECAVSMGEHFDLAAFILQSLNRVLTLQKEVDADSLKDLLH